MARLLWLAALALGPVAAGAGDNSAPYYTAASIANSAAGIANFYAPDTFVTIYGTNLAFVTAAISSEDLNGGILPTVLIGTGVRVLINDIAADMYYVSPTQVNILVPSNLIAGGATVQLEVNGVAGPAVAITLGASAPALFQFDASTALGTHADGSLITANSPAQPGEEIVLWATGLGVTAPPAVANQVPESAAPLADLAHFQVLLNGIAVDPKNIAYAGAAPGYAGLYQINLILPADTPANPQIQIATADATSPPQRLLPLQ